MLLRLWPKAWGCPLFKARAVSRRKKIRLQPWAAAGDDSARLLGGGLEQAFRLECLLDLGPGAHSLDVGFHIRPLAKIDGMKLRPVQNGEEVGIRHGELIAHEVFAG